MHRLVPFEDLPHREQKELVKHDAYGIAQARLQAAFSKDPGTKVGAAILRPDGTLASAGRNGFPKGIYDASARMADREVKLMLTLHAEENAILLAREPLEGYTLYVWPLPPCAHCAAAIIQSGIARVVYDFADDCDDVPERWLASMNLAASVFDEARVRLHRFDGEDPRPRAA